MELPSSPINLSITEKLPEDVWKLFINTRADVSDQQIEIGRTARRCHHEQCQDNNEDPKRTKGLILGGP